MMTRRLASSGRGHPGARTGLGLVVLLALALAVPAGVDAQEPAKDSAPATGKQATTSAPQEAGEQQADTGANGKDAEQPAEGDGEDAGSVPGTARAPALQQEATDTFLPNTNVAGQFAVGIRAVDVGGRDAKFREDYDLDDGARLLDTRLVFTPSQRTAGRWYDRATFEATGLGGDPYERWGFSVYKSQGYRFRLDNRTTDYFWAVTGEPHSWDVARTSTDGSLSVNALDNVEFHAAFGRWRQDGTRVTSRDISRDEIFFDEALDQDSSYFSGGARWNVERTDTTLFFDQEFRSFNDNGGFSAFETDGLTPGETFIDFLEQKEVRSVDAPIARGGVQQRAWDDRVRVDASFIYSNQTMGFDFSRVWEGENFQERPVFAQESAFGESDRLVRHGNLDVSIDVHPMVTVVGKYRRRNFDQSAASVSTEAEDFFLEGTSTFDTTFPETEYTIEHDQFLLGAEVRPDPRVTVFGEIGATGRDQRFVIDGDTEEENTETTALRLGAEVRPERRVSVKAIYERGDIDDPFTRISPTEQDRFNVRLRFNPMENVAIGGHVTYKDVTNTATEYTLESSSFGASATYSMPDRGWVTASLSRRNFDTNVPIVFRPFFGGSAMGEAPYESDDTVFSLAGDVTPTTEIPLSVFANLNVLDSGGSLAINWYDVRLGGRYTFTGGFFFQVEGRFLDFEEDSELPSDVDDYDARIATVSAGFKF